jgi:hypothetical protein
MQFIKFKSTYVFSNGSLFLNDSNLIKPKIITFLEKNLRNIEPRKDKKLNHHVKLKYSSTYKNRYLNSK